MFDPHLTVGQVITEKQVHEIFQCQTTFGIRMSAKNNLFVIMSGSAKKKQYDDIWDGNVLHYCGTDINSDSDSNQTLKKGRGNNNKQLADVWEKPLSTRPQLFLFVKKKENQCIFKGEVIPVLKPYMAPRPDDPSKMVYRFPLQLKEINSDKVESEFKKAEDESAKLSEQELYAKVKGKADDKQPKEATKQYQTKTTYYERNPDISAYAKLRAHGICDLCGGPAPFTDRERRPYLEAHHVIWLSNSGKDEIDNVVALCPNCHRKMHVVNDPTDVQILLDKITAYNSSIK